MTDQALPTIDDIRAAAARMGDAIMRTPCLPSLTLSRIAGCDLFLKFENLQFVASFKERGALNKLLTLTPDERKAGVIAMSAGNHAQGVAYHAARLGIPATIVMPRGTPMTKIGRTREHGAIVIVDGATFEEATAIAADQARAFGLTLIHPFDDAQVIAGQGTVGLEMLEQAPEIDTIVVPIGGGGLIAGIATAVKALAPHVDVVGVQALAYPSMLLALAGEGDVTTAGPTIAEGIAVKKAGTLTREVVRQHIRDILLVDEGAIEQAVALLQSVEKTVVEGAGAAALAAVLSHPERFAGRKVGIPLTGGNIDSRMFASVIMRDLVRSSQLMRFDVPISDRPRALAEIATALANEGANIVDVSHERLSLALNPKGAALDIVVELTDAAHGEAVIVALQAQGFDACVKRAG
jgi:threonine dehydratase